DAGYRIMVATSAADLPTDPTASAGGPSVIINATTAAGTTSYTPGTALNNSTTYYWEVHGRSTTVYGTWSGKNNFTTTIVNQPPTPQSPGTSTDTGYTVGDLMPTFTWLTAGATRYGLYISREPYGSANII